MLSFVFVSEFLSSYHFKFILVDSKSKIMDFGHFKSISAVSKKLKKCLSLVVFLRDYASLNSQVGQQSIIFLASNFNETGLRWKFQYASPAFFPMQSSDGIPEKWKQLMKEFFCLIDANMICLHSRQITIRCFAWFMKQNILKIFISRTINQNSFYFSWQKKSSDWAKLKLKIDKLSLT